jgi:putative membrane protein
MFSDADLTRIRDSVRAAELRTRGEIVPMIVPASARYREAEHRAAALLAFAVLAVISVGIYGGEWTTTHPGWVIAGVLGAYVAGTIIGRAPLAIRVLVSDARMAEKVRLRARAAFYEQGLHRTREGTGVLIFLSLLERRVQVLADEAINRRVSEATWSGIVDTVVEGVKRGHAADALCRAITTCGDTLAEHFPARPGDNPNELGDEAVVKRD